MFEFFLIRMDTNEKNCDSEYSFRPRSDPCEICFVGTHQPVTGAEHPSSIKNKVYTYAQTDLLSQRER